MLILFVSIFDSKYSIKNLRQPNKVTKEEQRAIDMLVSLNESNKEKVISLLSHLSDEQQEELRSNVQDYFHEQQIKTLNFLSVCPSLTPSEIEICKLILLGKSLKEICFTLHKTSSNITSQRTHIRRKLNLSKHDDLRISLISLLNKP